MKKTAIFFGIAVLLIAAVLLPGLLRTHPGMPKAPEISGEEALHSFPEAYNSVRGHDERMMIAGNFTGAVTDTLDIVYEPTLEYRDTNCFVTLDGKTFEVGKAEDDDWMYQWDVRSRKG